MNAKQQSNIRQLAPKLSQRTLAPDTPYSELLERSVIAAMLRYEKFAERVIAEVGDRKMFFLIRHQMIFDAIVSVTNAGDNPCDVVRVSEQLLADGTIEDMGGPSYLTELIVDFRREEIGTPSLDGYITGLKGYYARWEMLRAADELRNQAYDMKHPPDKALYKAQSALNNVSEFVMSDVFTPMSVSTQLHADRTEHAADHVQTIPTGILSIDNKIGGLRKQKVIVVAGRPHHGKTSLSISIAYNIAKAGGRVAIFNVADGTKHDVLSRIIAMEAGISYSAVASGSIKIGENGRYIEALRKIDKMKISIQSTKGMTMPQLQAEAKALAGMNGLDLVVIDYIQRLTVDTTNPKAPRDSFSQMAHISQSITKIAEQLDVPIIVAAQINRAGKGSLPDVSHIKGCGNIEEDADMVWLVYRDWLDDNSHRLPQQIQIKIGKNKVDGHLGTVFCDINEFSTYIKSR